MRGVYKKWVQDDLLKRTDIHTISVKHFVMTGVTDINVCWLSRSPKHCTTLHSLVYNMSQVKFRARGYLNCLGQLVVNIFGIDKKECFWIALKYALH